MKRWQIAASAAAALGAVLLLLQALTPPPARQVAPAGEEGPAQAPGAAASDEARRAEERLLAEQAFSHAVSVPAPPLEAQGADGKPVRFAPAAGRVVLVNFWATWCPPCVKEMPSLMALGRDLQRRHPKDFQMVAVSGDDTWDAVHAYFAKNFGGEPPFLTLLRDPDAGAARTYYCAARGYCPDVKFPETYVVDRTGKIAAMIVGERDWSKPEARQLLEFLIRG